MWSEKDTVRGTLAPVLDKYRVTFRVMRGFSSATVVNQVVDETRDSENPLLVLYVGDWDPSGMCMSEVDLPKRLAEYGGSVEIERVALIEEHVADRGLPWFDASTKAKDPRYGAERTGLSVVAWRVEVLGQIGDRPGRLKARRERAEAVPFDDGIPF